MSKSDLRQKFELAFQNGRDIAGKPNVKRFVFAIAAGVFGIGCWIALRRIDLDFQDVTWWPIIVVAVLGVTGTQSLNAIETELSANSIGQSFGFRAALELSILGSAANMLPIPGAAIVRISALSAGGARLRDSGAVTFAIALIWAGIAFLLAGTALLASAPLVAPSVQLFGFVALAGAAIWLRKLGSTWTTVMFLALVKIALVGLSIVRIQLCLLAIGMNATFAQSTVFGISSLLGSAVSIVPAGLGIRELASAVLAPVVGIEASSAFIATALDRLIGVVVLFLLTLGLTLYRRKRA